MCVKSSKTENSFYGQRPAVCVIIPCYNAETTIARTLNSVIAQSYPNIEIILSDDGSSDKSIEVAEKFGDRIKIISSTNQGACHARNLGLKATSAEYVLFLDADDEIQGDYFSEGVRVAENGSADLVFSPVIYRTAEKIIGVRDIPVMEMDCHDLFENWLLGTSINPSGLLWRRSFIDDIGRWNENVLIQQDGELMLRALLHEPVILQNLRGYGIYYVHNPQSLSGEKSRKKIENYVENIENFLNEIKGTSFSTRLAGFEDALYGSAKLAFRAGWKDLGVDALTLLRTIGPIRHKGSLSHRVASSILGLELKMRLFKGR